MRFRVWAPRPARVEVVVDGATWPMEPDGGGWWAAEVAGAGPGSRYGFSLDGGLPLPDPRSLSQPDGPEGLSAVVDHSTFRWTDDGWRGRELAGAVVYELHVGTFSPEGTFDGAIAHLPELAELGVDLLEVLPPVTASGDRGWGYDGVDLFSVHAAYGGPEACKRFVDACHAHGLGVLVDVVYNHLGPVGNHLAKFGPYFTDRHSTPWGDAVNVDGPDAAEVRRFVLDNARSWLQDFHADGLRLDAVHAIVDTSEVHLLAELAAEVRELEATLGRRLVLVAESDANDPTLVRDPPEGYGLDAVWADDWHHALHTLLTGERAGYYEDFGEEAQLAKALRQAWVYDGVHSKHRDRVVGSSPRGVPADRFVVALQNHDQIGNRAQGERLAALVPASRLRIAAALLLTAPFTPMLFQGEEWGASTPFQYFTDHRDPELAEAVRTGRRSEFAAFGWAPEDVPDPQDPATFVASRLDRSEQEREPHASLRSWYRELLALRRAEPALHDPAVAVDATVEDGVITVRRGPWTVVANIGSRPVQVGEDLGPAVLAAGLAGGALEPDGVALCRQAG